MLVGMNRHKCRASARRVAIRVLTCSLPDQKTCHAGPPALGCSERVRLSVHGRTPGQLAAGGQTQERERAHGSESRACVVAVRRNDDWEKEVEEEAETSVLGDVSSVEHIRG